VTLHRHPSERALSNQAERTSQDGRARERPGSKGLCQVTIPHSSAKVDSLEFLSKSGRTFFPRLHRFEQPFLLAGGPGKACCKFENYNDRWKFEFNKIYKLSYKVVIEEIDDRQDCRFHRRTGNPAFRRTRRTGAFPGAGPEFRQGSARSRPPGSGSGTG